MKLQQTGGVQVEETKTKIIQMVNSIDNPKILDNLYAIVMGVIDYYSVPSQKSEAD